MTYAAALKTTTHPKTRCRKQYAATQHPILLMMAYVPETRDGEPLTMDIPEVTKNKKGKVLPSSG